jgi:integrase/recombinase XerD
LCEPERQRCFIFLLWESAARLGEALALNVGDAKPTKYGVNIRVTGKTGKRDILLIDSVPDVQMWLNMHNGKDQDPLFPIARREGRLQARGAQTILLRLQQKAGLTKKRIWIYGFRHGRLTELSNQGMTEPQLRLFAGWGNDSAMPSTYISTSLIFISAQTGPLDTFI